MATVDKPQFSAPGHSAGRRIHGTIAHDLGIAIVTGLHPSGTVLSGEVAQSEQLRVSRSAYREAIKILGAKGLVESRPKAGTRVTSRDRWNLLDPDVLAWAFEGEPTSEFVRDLFELRQIVEPSAAELAAKRRDDEDLARLGHAVEEMARHGLATSVGQDADQAFHSAVLRATHNAALNALASSIAAAVGWTTLFKATSAVTPARSNDGSSRGFCSNCSGQCWGRPPQHG